MSKSCILTICYCSFLIGLDQISKYFFYNLGIGSKFFIFYPLSNEGISWGISIPMRIIIAITILCIILFVYLYYKKYISVLEFIFLFAGTLGNCIDRILLGGVRDFISIGSFPVFNLADVFLTCGVGIIFIKEILNSQIFHLQTK